MKAVTVVPRKKGTLAVRDIAEPEPGHNELLLEVSRVGICGTDMDIIAGFYGEAPEGAISLVLGHESLSRVLEVGDEAVGFKKGELVVPTVRRNCAENCPNCVAGESDMCTTGHYKEHGIKGLDGFASERAVTDSRFVVKLPESLSEVGVLLEPLTIVEKAVVQTFLIQNARMKWNPAKAIVLGSGPVGLLATAVLRLRGLEVETVARKPEESLKARLARSTGANYIDASKTPLSSLGGRYDFVLEATGATAVATTSQSLSGPNGAVSLVGIYSPQPVSEDAGRIFTDMVLGNRLLFGSVNANISYFRQGVEDLARVVEKWPGLLQSIITTKVPISRGEEAYAPKDGEEIKTVLEL